MLPIVLALVGLCAVASAETLAVYAGGFTGQTDAAFPYLQEELSHIVSPLELNVVWRDLANRNREETFPTLVVARFQGACSLESPVQVRDEGRELAVTSVSDGMVLPFMKIDCNRIRQLLAVKLAGRKPAVQNRLFGRALGRVLAHELYHILAQTRGHRDQGISKPCFSLSDLTAEEFHFDLLSLAQMRPAAASQPAEESSGR